MKAKHHAKATALSNHQELFCQRIESDLIALVKHNKLSVEKIAASYGITDKTEVKEFTELAIVRRARAIVAKQLSIEETFEEIVELYHHQVNLSHRTSQSMLLQQYSTPAPIGYLAGLYCGVHIFNPSNGFMGFEPSAGNGLLTIAAKPSHFVVNEIDRTRNLTLQSQGYKGVYKVDATDPFERSIDPDYFRLFDAVITNPPFGRLDKSVSFDNYQFRTLEHVMSLRALDTMADTGRAAIIVGGHTRWDKLGRINSADDLKFFNYLYTRYNVDDVIFIDGAKLYSRQGTSFDTRLILINGRKKTISGAAPLFTEHAATVEKSFKGLFQRVMEHYTLPNLIKPVKSIIKSLEDEADELNRLMNEEDDLGSPYIPASNACIVLDTVVPDAMDSEVRFSLERLKEAVGGDIDEFVRQRLKYPTKTELCQALAAEQIDGVAMAIYNIEVRKQGTIIGDQTGIGKGREAAAIIRYGVNEGLKPIFITEKATLFSDMFRDLKAIGSAHLIPFIVNARESKTDVKDEDGNIIYQAPEYAAQERILKSGKVPYPYNFVMATYSQFSSPETQTLKPNFLIRIAEENIIIMDESHNASGSSNTGRFMREVVSYSKGVSFLSATFAKRPDNMPVYAMKTAIREANVNNEQLVAAITAGGVALQEVLASQLVQEGQMIRRERSFDGVEVNYFTMSEKEQEHRAISDNITEILRDIIAFQRDFINPEVKEMDKLAAEEGKSAEIRKGTHEAGVSNEPYFSKVFMVINQMLFSIKSEEVAERAIKHLKEGKKPVIAFSSTMGSFIEEMENNVGLPVTDGDIIKADFSHVLMRGLDGILRYSVIDQDGKSVHHKFDIDNLTINARFEYIRIKNKIKNISTGISISPIDRIIEKLQAAGYSVAEVTGRKYNLQFNNSGNTNGELVAMVRNRKKINANDAFRLFNNNEKDVLLINQSGSTGASAHAIPTERVPKDKVKQRVMLILQAELDINTEVQKRGRINRTGQIYKPIYDYIISSIPAEMRLMMLLQKKLKSLDANTSSNQKQSSKILDVPDFLNKYGDKIVTDYLAENKEVNRMLDNPLNIREVKEGNEEKRRTVEDAALKISGYVAVLSTKMQQEFYEEVSQKYNDYVDYMKQIDEYDLEVEAMNLQADTISKQVVIMGKGGDSAFGDDTILETVNANVLKKPFSKNELKNILNESLGNANHTEKMEALKSDFIAFYDNWVKEETTFYTNKFEEYFKQVSNDKVLSKIRETKGEEAYQEALDTKIKMAEKMHKDNIDGIQKTYNHRTKYMLQFLNFFYIGKPLQFPFMSFANGSTNVYAVFLGFVIDKKYKNPYTPSAVKLRFAISNGTKYVTMPASYGDKLLSIKGASADVPDLGMDATLQEWETNIKASNIDRQLRHIITGNLLQAYGSFRGKLVSYTTVSGDVMKGILMPENWVYDDEVKGSVVVPMLQAKPIVMSLREGDSIVTNNNLSIIRLNQGFKLIISASKSRGGDIYLDEDILKLVEKNMFEKISDKMEAYIDTSNLPQLLKLLQDKHGANVNLSPTQFQIIKKPNQGKRGYSPLPKAEVRQDNFINEDDEMLALEAEALQLELELLAL